MELGQRIKEKRKAERLSAESLALKLGLKKDNIYKWERGSKPSDPEEYQKLMLWLENGKSQNGIDSNNTPVKPQEAQHAPDYRDEIIALLKEKSNSNERQTLLMLQRNQALLNAVIQTLIEMEVKAGKKHAHEEMNKRISNALDVVKKEGI